MEINHPLSNIKIILVEPAGPLNIGSVARSMKNMALNQLVLVNPQCDHLGDEARRMAVHAQDLLEQATIFPTLSDALVGIERAIATTALNRALAGNDLEPPRQVLPWLFGQPSALIFGREDRGLTNAELNYAQKFLQIPTNQAYSSLNLAQAVTVCCYELHQIFRAEYLDSSVNANPTPEKEPPATIENLEGYYQHLERVLLKINFLYPSTTISRMEKFRRLYNRANLSANEVALLRGILRQVEWSINQSDPQSPD